MAAIYLRVSTRDQTTLNQRLELERIALAKGWTLAQVYEDHGVSGTAGRDKRAGFDNLLKDALRRRFDVLMAWDVSRLGRSLSHLVQALDDLHSNGVDVYLHQQAIDTTLPSGKALFQMCAVFAEFERAMISERVRAGLSRARAQGKTLGRPRSSIDAGKVHADRDNQMTMRQIASKHSLSLGTVANILRARSRGK